MAEQSVERVRIDGGVLVGLDSSASAAQALILGVAEARLRGAVLNVLRAWSIRTAPRPADVPVQVMPSMEQFEQAVREDTQRIISETIGAPEAAVEIHVVRSPAPQALLTASRDADLLVVGHRGRGGFAGLLLGSVAEQCVRHAACPVLVARPSF